MSDIVNHPSHYKAGDLEVIAVAEAFALQHDAYLFNVLTYILRAGRKGNADEDLRKALNYLHRRVHGRWIHEAGTPSHDGVGAADADKRAWPGRLIYLATPYSKYRHGIERAWMDACVLVSRLMKRGFVVYSPIAHGHPIAKFGTIDPLDHAVWLPFAEAMMTACDALLVAQMDGWDKSKGIAHEIAVFEQAGKPVRYLDPVSLSIQTVPIRMAVAGRDEEASA